MTNDGLLDCADPDCDHRDTGCAVCGDGVCGGGFAENETCGSCPLDCGVCPMCGDGTIQAFEECDDGNRDDGDGCSSSCQSESCGDGVLQAHEACELVACGSGVCPTANVTCGDLGFTSEAVRCLGCAFDTEVCTGPYCGDGVLHRLRARLEQLVHPRLRGGSEERLVTAATESSTSASRVTTDTATRVTDVRMSARARRAATGYSIPGRHVTQAKWPKHAQTSAAPASSSAWPAAYCRERARFRCLSAATARALPKNRA